LALTPAPGAARDYDAGLDAYGSGDYATALREWRPLAEQGHAGAQYGLGLMYYNGEGVVQDDPTAHMWLDMAAANGSEDAGKARDVVASRMTAEAISQSQRRAWACMQSNYQDCN